MARRPTPRRDIVRYLGSSVLAPLNPRRRRCAVVLFAVGSGVFGFGEDLVVVRAFGKRWWAHGRLNVGRWWLLGVGGDDGGGGRRRHGGSHCWGGCEIWSSQHHQWDWAVSESITQLKTGPRRFSPDLSIYFRLNFEDGPPSFIFVLNGSLIFHLCI